MDTPLWDVYVGFWLVLVALSAGTAMWSGSDRRKDAFAVYKLAVPLLVGSGGALAVGAALVKAGLL